MVDMQWRFFWEEAFRAAATAKKTKNQKTLTTTALFFFFSRPLASAVYTPALDQVIGDFKIEDNPTLADLTVSAYVLGFSAGPLLLAPLSETFGKKPVYQICNVVLLACNLACMVAPSAEWLIVFRFLAGCAGASPITQGTGTATDVMTKEKRARAMSVMAFGSVCSPAVGSALGGAIAQAWGWRGCFGFLALMVRYLLFYCRLREHRFVEGKEKKKKASWEAFDKGPGLRFEFPTTCVNPGWHADK